MRRTAVRYRLSGYDADVDTVLAEAAHAVWRRMQSPDPLTVRRPAGYGTAVIRSVLIEVIELRARREAELPTWLHDRAEPATSSSAVIVLTRARIEQAPGTVGSGVRRWRTWISPSAISSRPTTCPSPGQEQHRRRHGRGRRCGSPGWRSCSPGTTPPPAARPGPARSASCSSTWPRRPDDGGTGGDCVGDLPAQSRRFSSSAKGQISNDVGVIAPGRQ